MSEHPSVDWNDSKELWSLSREVVLTANSYRKSRNDFASAKKTLDLMLAMRYKNKLIPRKVSYEKALIFLIEEGDKTITDLYETMTQEEANYKGLEKLLEAKQSQLSLAQSLIKNQIRNS